MEGEFQMRIAVSSSGQDLDAPVDPRFGRCAFFIIVNPEDLSFESHDNASIALGGGAGIQAAQFVSSKGAEVVITGNCGPNAIRTLKAAGVQVVLGQTGTVRQVVERYRDGNLSGATEANVPDHFGMGGSGLGGGRCMGGAGRRSKGARGGGTFDRGDPPERSREDELQTLKADAQELRTRMEDIQSRIHRLTQDMEKRSH
jgi:predicted Fe-Mo cluster-binding NifX family protein